MNRNNIGHSLEDGVSVNLYSSLEEGKTIANVTLRKEIHLIKLKKLQPKQITLEKQDLHQHLEAHLMNRVMGSEADCL